MPVDVPAPAVRGRFAPSPTGPLHFGSLFTALGSWLLARHAGGEWLVRIEDLDPPREVAGAAQSQLDTLAAFGLVPDAGPWWQGTRGAAYAAALEPLLASGAAFECRCSRAELAAAGGVHHACVTRRRGGPSAIRLRVPPGTEVTFEDRLHGRRHEDVHAMAGDVVLRRADGPWAYQFAVVVDDAAQRITDVVRGADLLSSTARQIVLQRALGLPTPRYAHLPAILGPDGRKLSKSMQAVPVDAADPLAALQLAWRGLGQPALAERDAVDAQAWLREARLRFDPAGIPRTPAIPIVALHEGGPVASA